MGSASELDYHLLLCRDFEFITAAEYDRQSKELIRVRKMLFELLTSIENQIQGNAKAARA
jgi:four helix bundle protein